MLSCRQVADIIPAADWSFSQKVQLKLHLLYCSRCRALERQFQVLDQSLRRLLNEAPRFSPVLVEKSVQDYLRGHQ